MRWHASANAENKFGKNGKIFRGKIKIGLKLKFNKFAFCFGLFQNSFFKVLLVLNFLFLHGKPLRKKKIKNQERTSKKKFLNNHKTKIEVTSQLKKCFLFLTSKSPFFFRFQLQKKHNFTAHETKKLFLFVLHFKANKNLSKKKQNSTPCIVHRLIYGRRNEKGV